MRIRYKLDKVDFSSIRGILSRFGGHLKPHRFRLAMSTLSLIGVSLLTILQPWPLKIVFDYVLLPGRAKSASLFSFLSTWSAANVLAVAALSILVLALAKGLLAYTHNVQAKVVGHKLIGELRLRLFSHVQRLPQSYHDYRQTGELMTRMTGDLSLVKDLLVSTMISLASQLLLLVGMIAVMMFIDWKLTLATLAVIPFFTVAAFRFSGRIKSSARRQRQTYGQMIASIQESFAGIAQVKGFGQEKEREKIISRSTDSDVKANVKTTKLAANYTRTVELINAAGACLLLWLGARKVMAGLITPGDLLIFLAYLRGLYRPLQNMAKLTTRIAKATVRGEKLMEILDLEVEVKDKVGAVSAKDISGDIRFDDINFSYVDGRPVLDGCSCHIPSKKTTVIIGPTGAGKSTIAKLILRLYRPTSGSIHLDGRPIEDYKITSLRKRITPLAQEAFLFRTSIGENIAFGKRRATQEAIENAARLAGIDTFIQQLPDGYDTLLGEGGMTLSGGQRQRLSFARAALRESPVMIFDEPATGLDIHAEQEAKSVLSAFRHERTVIIITHRLHFLDLSDWVIFIRDGRVVEEGTRKKLMDRGGDFCEFVSASEPHNVALLPDRGLGGIDK